MQRLLPRFSTREMLLLMTVVAIAIAWWNWSGKPASSVSYPADAMVIKGPLKVDYRIQTSPSSTVGSNGLKVDALIITEGAVIFDHGDLKGRLLDRAKVVELSWRKQ